MPTTSQIAKAAPIRATSCDNDGGRGGSQCCGCPRQHVDEALAEHHPPVGDRVRLAAPVVGVLAMTKPAFAAI